jgi:ectoine hydroxylase-related dioxygenase (phytanoyl-CoA dioxygenase family)
MRLTTDQLTHYREEGFLLLPGCFSPAEVEVMKSQLPAVFGKEGPQRIVEQNGGVVRSVYGTHEENDVFARLARHPRMIEPARQITDGDVYVYQFKINAKVAFAGDVWEWHQDYIFWRNEDGLPAPRITNAVVFLDEVNDFNGPLYLIPRSHRQGVIDTAARASGNKNGGNGSNSSNGGNGHATAAKEPAWINNLTARLKYSLDREVVADLVKRNGIVAAKGPVGTVLIFDSNIVHGSSNNISPFDRVIVIVTFNSVENLPAKTTNRRPDFLVSRNYQPITALSDDALRLWSDAQSHNGRAAR